jgi:DNA-directed RNA polymerase subunit RPC12/RpoP
MEVIMQQEAYCMKCKKKVEIKDAKNVTTKNGRNMISGLCPDCGTKVSKITGKK